MNGEKVVDNMMDRLQMQFNHGGPNAVIRTIHVTKDEMRAIKDYYAKFTRIVTHDANLKDIETDFGTIRLTVIGDE